MKRALISLAVCIFTVTATAAAPIEQQRETYIKINQLLNASQNEIARTMAKNLLAEIPDYPLSSYIEYRLMNADKSGLTLADIDDFNRHYPDFPFADELKKQWLLQLQYKKDWPAVLKNAAKLPTDKSSQCILLQAKVATKTDTAVSNDTAEKTPQNPTALFRQTLTELWLTGDSLPRSCDPVLEQWNNEGGLNDQLIRQRALLALEQNNGGLLAHLRKMTKDSELLNWLTDLQKLNDAPRNLLDKENRFYIENKPSADNPTEKRILLAVYPKYLKTLSEKEILSVGLFGRDVLYADLAKRFNLTEEQINQWKKIPLARVFDNEDTELQRQRDKQLLQIKDDELLERRIRMAIREKEDRTLWLEALSPTAKAKDEWRYWQAKILQQQGKKAQAEELLATMLQSPRGFYPMLAAAELKRPYRPQMHELANIVMKQRKAKKHSVNIAHQYAHIFERISEFRKLNDNTSANLEWKHLLNKVSFEQKLHLAQYAESRQWYDLQVEATIQAKAWHYLRLRLPNAYTDWFDLNLKGKKIDRTFAMAIARQESAWKPYVTSSADARGLMQLLPSTAKVTALRGKLPYDGAEQLFEPFTNIMLGTAHLQELYDRFGNNRILIAAAYNAGPQRVEQWLKKADGKLTLAEFVASIPFFETRGYVQNVLAYDTYYQILQEKPQQLFSQEEYNRLY